MVAPKTNKFKFCGFFSFFWHPWPPWGRTSSGYINDFVIFSAIFDWKRPLVEFITWQIPVLCKPVCFMSIKHGNLYTFDNHFLIFPNLSSTDLERNKEKFPTVLSFSTATRFWSSEKFFFAFYCTLIQSFEGSFLNLEPICFFIKSYTAIKQLLIMVRRI